eukprot:3249354-Ditylum_brightwellii.AAC.1
MSFFLQTGHGDSETSYGGTWDDPFQTLCQVLFLVALIFVDDTDLLAQTSSTNPDALSVIPSMQQAVRDWKGALKVTGGVFKPPKCFFQAVGFCWRDGNWSYQTLIALHPLIFIMMMGLGKILPSSHIPRLSKL